MNADDQRKQIEEAQAKGFKPGQCYWRGATLMVEITPGNFVNEAKAREYGIEPRGDVQYAASGAGR
jgi:hypothetical protein